MNDLDSILNHLDASHRPDDLEGTPAPLGEDGQPMYKNHCCMKYSVDKQCRRCPFRQIADEENQQKALDECRDKRRGRYTYHDKSQDCDIIIAYNNQYQ